MNQRCPCTKEEKEEDSSIMTDIKSHLTTSKRYFPSILVLAKIVPETGEEILGAKLLGNDKLLIQSMIEPNSEVIYKMYNITDFEASARINPFHQNILANSLYSWKLKVNSNEGKTHISLWKKYTLEEELDLYSESSDQDTLEKEKKIQKITSDIMISNNNLAILVEQSRQGWTVFLDKQTLSFILWKENTIRTTNAANIIGSFHNFEVFKEDTCVLINKEGQIFMLDQAQLPDMIIKQTPYVLPDIENLQFQIMDFWNPEGELDLWHREGDNLKIINLIYYWEDNFHCLDLNGTRTNVLFGLKDEREKGFAWRFLQRRRESQRVIFYTKNGILHIYDIDKSKHHEIQFVFEPPHLDLEFNICAESPSKLFIYSQEPQTVVFEVDYQGDIDNFFTKPHLIAIDYFTDVRKTISSLVSSQKILQVEQFPSKKSVVLIRVKDPVYYDNAHLIVDNGSVLNPPIINSKMNPAIIEEKPKRCDYHTLVDRIEFIKKHIERFQCDIKFLEEVEQIKKDIQETISKKIQTTKEKKQKYKEYRDGYYERMRREIKMECVEEPKTVDYRKFLRLYKEIKQIQKGLKIAGKMKIRQNSREKASLHVDEKV